MGFPMLAPIFPIAIPVITMGFVMVMFGSILIKLVTWLPKLLKLILSIADPEVFFRDLIYGVFTGLTMIISSVVDIISGILISIFNKLGFTDDFLGLRPKKGKKTCPKSVKCVRPTFFKYIILVICPPLYILMAKGLKAWIYILIDIVLTLAFYFPGLIYATLITQIC